MSSANKEAQQLANCELEECQVRVRGFLQDDPDITAGVPQIAADLRGAQLGRVQPGLKGVGEAASDSETAAGESCGITLPPKSSTTTVTPTLLRACVNGVVEATDVEIACHVVGRLDEVVR
jgi:hypothetical protein